MKLKEALKSKLTEQELELVNTSYDVIGDIAIIELDDKLKKKEKIIGQALLDLNSNIKTILKKKGIHKGKYRVQKHEYIIGENKNETEYKENNCRFILDVSEVYFSPRLSTERLRIANLVKKDEDVLVMFSGIGVYPVIISKNSKAKSIYGVEINKKAHEYARKNVSLNLVSNVYLYCMDVRELDIKKKFDRIIMPLPKESVDFLDVAKKFIKKNGVIHLYIFANEEEVQNKVQEVINKNFKKFKILDTIKCGNFAPGVHRYCVDFIVK